MDKPTEAQVKEFWEWYGRHIYWTRKQGWSAFPPIDPTNLLRWAVPKVKYCSLTKPEHKSYKGMWLCEVRVEGDSAHSENKDPALALFWALWEVKDNG